MPSPYQHTQKKGQGFTNLTNVHVSLLLSQRFIEGENIYIYKYVAAKKNPIISYSNQCSLSFAIYEVLFKIKNKDYLLTIF